MSAHTKHERYCSLHHRWFNACCWECEEGDADHETQEEREQQRVETYREAQRDEQRSSSGV